MSGAHTALRMDELVMDDVVMDDLVVDDLVMDDLVMDDLVVMDSFPHDGLKLCATTLRKAEAGEG